MGKSSSEIKKIRKKMEHYTKYRESTMETTIRFTKEDALMISKGA